MMGDVLLLVVFFAQSSIVGISLQTFYGQVIGRIGHLKSC